MSETVSLDDLYTDLHAHPELGFQEHRTAAIAAERMRLLGLTVTEGIGGTGVAAVLENGAGPVVWLRADMDGLPVEEKTGLEYASTATVVGADGIETPVMHACGHDMHVTWLIGAMERLAAERADWSGTVVAIFQPAEETIVGAKAMIDDGLLDRVPRPSIVLGQHVAPFPAGIISLTSGAAMAGVDDLTVTLHGRGGHGSRPETTIDPVLAAASTVVRLQSIVSREVTPGKLAVLTVGRLHAGTKSNIIPDDATLDINIRTIDPEIRDRVLGSVRRIVEGEAAASGMATPPTITMNMSAPATVNSAEHTEILRASFADAWGSSIIDYGTVSGSEDVGQFATAAGVPLVFWITGGSDPETVMTAQAAGRFEQDIPSNHSPYFAPILHPTIERGVDALVLGAQTFLGAR
ncbi:amidohydrolase [Agromyces atrinae]|uniref:Amidohydrolase n=1 Tax=Agromyces atrinae TaxID=592376 RepID=A0A4Q2M4L6_9MICO|nr:amidohydrolase [Agromyces atrinae]NYD67332.1 hippurate hydrolase [Agromyces atrinae]RXZ86839.1 amidohydrolase [Agromyces atrinae]